MKATQSDKSYRLSVLLCATMGVWLNFAQLLQAATDTWVGNSSALFSGANWAGGNNPPSSGDALVFGTAGTAGTALTADQAVGISYAGITFNSGASAYTIGGANGITLTGNIVNNGTSLETLNFPIAATAARTFTTTASGGDITLGGYFTGTGGGITKTGAGNLNLSGVNNFTGTFIASAGQVNITANSTTSSAGFNNIGNTASTTAIVGISSGATLTWSGANGGNFGGATSASGVLYNSGTFNISGTSANNCGTYLPNATTTYGYIYSPGSTTVAGRLWMAQGNGAVGVLDIPGGTVTVGGANDTFNQVLYLCNAGAVGGAGINITAGGTLAVSLSGMQAIINNAAGDYTSVNITGTGSKMTLVGDAGFCLNNVNSAASTNIFTVANGGELDCAYTFNNNAAAVNTFFNFNGGIVKATATDGGGLFINNTTIYVESGGATINDSGFSPKVNVPLLAPSGNGVTSIALGGTTNGYIGAPLVKISGGGGNGASAIANFNPSSGTITNITVTSPGSGYTSAPTVTLVGGNGGSTGAAAGTATATASIGAVSSGGLIKTGSGTVILNAANTYTGNTIISAGTLSLQNSGSLASGNIIVSNNATLNVSSVSFTLASGQSLLGYGTNNGAVGTTSGSKIYAGTDGGYGTNTFSGNLTLVSGSTCYFDLTTNYNGSNDLINVTGSLVDNGSVQISAPSSSVNLDTNQNYVLLTSTGLSGTISPTPLWGVKPLNWRNFTVVQNGNNVELHYTASTPPVATGSANPATMLRNQSTLVSVTVTPGTGSIDPNTGVSLDESSLGLSSVYLVLSGTPNVYTNTLSIPATVAAGNFTLVASITDSTPLTGSANIALTILATNQVWNGAGANNLSDNNTNWTSGSAPGYVGDAMTFAGSVNTSPDLDQNYTVTGVIFNTNASSFTISTAESTTLTLTNGTGVVNSSTNAQTLNVPVALSTAQTFNTTSGDLAISGSISGNGALTKTGNKTLTLAGANSYSGLTTVNVGTLAFSGSGISSIGNLFVHGGQLNVTAGTVNVNDTSGALTKVDGGATAVVSGGSLNIGGSGGWFPIGDTASTTGTLTVSGGNVNIVNSFGAQVARTGNGVLTITNGGSFLVNDVNTLGLSLSEGGGQSTVNLDGGTVSMNRLRANSGTEVFNFNGGTLAAIASRTDFFPSSGALTANVRNGGAIVDTAGLSVTIAQPLAHSTIGGDNATDGGLTVTNSSGTGYLTLAGANTYTGPTLVAAGYLLLGASGSIANSSSITVSNGAYFDVSALATYTLNSGQNLKGSGQVNVAQNGLVAAASGCAIYPGTDGTVGNLTINGGLALNSGATANVDVGTTYNGANDQLTVSGTLTLNGNSLHIKAPSTLSSLDSTADYVLITASSIVGSFSSTPVWDVKPVNWANYTVVTSGSQVVLHYSTLTPPTGFGVAVPSTVVHDQSVLISVTVTNGSGTVDPNTGVVLNASTIGGSPSVNLILSSTISSSVHVYTNTITVPGSAAAGNYTLTAQITDSNSQIGTANISLAVTTTEVWNGGGSSTNQNWSNNPNWAVGMAPELSGDSLIFAGTVGTSPNMDNSYSVTGLTFSNNAASFNIGTTTSSTLTLTGGVTNNSANAQTLNVPIADAGGGLTKSGNGTIILSAVNTYTGDTTINAGSLNIGGAGQLNSGTYSAAIVNSGTFAYNSSAAQVLSGVISGSGSLTQSGAGTLVLDNANNTFSGNITISGYVLATNDTAFNNGNGAVKGPLGNPATTNRTITVNSGGTLVLAAGNVFGDGGSSIAPAVSLVINQGGAVQTAPPIPTFPGNGDGDANIFGNITLNGGTFSTGNGYANSPDYQAAILMGSVTVGGSAASTINSIASNGNANGLMLGKQGGGTVTFTVASTGAGGADLMVTAPLVNAPNNTTGALLKMGSGTLQLDATNTYAGSTTVSNGTLIGKGILAGPVVVASTGAIGAGDAGPNVGGLTINNDLTLQGAATLRISKTGGTLKNDLITGISTVTYGGSLVVNNITTDATPLAAGDTFTLFSAGTHSGSFASIVGSPGTGLQYSFTNGVLSVITTGPSGPASLTNSISGGVLSLSWPAGQGWRLQMQTNSLATGLGTNWNYVTDGSVSSTNISVDSTKPAVFYRLKYP